MSVPPAVGAVAGVITFITACVAFARLIVSGSSASSALLPWVGRIYLLGSALVFGVVGFHLAFPTVGNRIRDKLNSLRQSLKTAEPHATQQDETPLNKRTALRIGAPGILTSAQ